MHSTTQHAYFRGFGKVSIYSQMLAAVITIMERQGFCHFLVWLSL